MQFSEEAQQVYASSQQPLQGGQAHKAQQLGGSTVGNGGSGASGAEISAFARCWHTSHGLLGRSVQPGEDREQCSQRPGTPARLEHFLGQAPHLKARRWFVGCITNTSIDLRWERSREEPLTRHCETRRENLDNMIPGQSQDNIATLWNGRV